MTTLAVDVGFGFTKATDGRRIQVFKSIVGNSKLSPFADNVGTLPSDYPRALRVDDVDSFVGELAEVHSAIRQYTLNPDEFLRTQVKVLGLAGILPFAPSAEPINLVTGLPISLFKEGRHQMAEIFTGQHEIEVILGENKRRAHVINIDRVRVIPQPFGSVFCALLDESGAPVDDRLLNSKIGIIDVGFKTCDYALADRARYADRGAKSTDAGISSAYQVVADKLRDESGVDIELYRLHEAIQAGTIKIRTQRHDLREVADAAFKGLAEEVAGAARTLWREDWDMETVVLTGGGSSQLVRYLKPMIEESVNNAEVIDGISDLRAANVLGYYKFGRHLWESRSTAETESDAAVT